jgi:hypothetical protein
MQDLITRQAGQPLTKENFWNALEQAHPTPVQNFWLWMEDYYKRHDWDLLFWNFSRPPRTRVDFVNLPLAMQIGILLEYLMYSSKKDIARCFEPFTIEALVHWLPSHFVDVDISRQTSNSN